MVSAHALAAAKIARRQRADRPVLPAGTRIERDGAGGEWLSEQCSLGHWHPCVRVFRVSLSDYNEYRKRAEDDWFTIWFPVLFVAVLVGGIAGSVVLSPDLLRAGVTLAFFAKYVLVAAVPVGALFVYHQFRAGRLRNHRETVRREILERHGLDAGRIWVGGFASGQKVMLWPEGC